MKIIRNDTVEVITGKDQGKRGLVRQVLPDKGRVVVESVNVFKRHLKKGRARQTGIVQFEAPIDASNVMIVCPSCDKPTRIGHEFTEDGLKIRVCRRCGTELPRKVV